MITFFKSRPVSLSARGGVLALFVSAPLFFFLKNHALPPAQARHRSKKHAERVARLRAEQGRVERGELRVGDGTGYGFMSADGTVDIESVGVACAALINDLFEARNKLVNATRRQRLAQEQFDSFRLQFEEKADEIQADFKKKNREREAT